MRPQSLVQDFIWRSWQSVPPADRVEVRLFLMTFLTAAPLPRLVSNKLVKVIIDIAKQEWPHGFPEFLPTIQQLTLEPASLSLGLLMIKTMNEEFTGRRDDVPAVRKEELQRVRSARGTGGAKGKAMWSGLARGCACETLVVATF